MLRGRLGRVEAKLWDEKSDQNLLTERTAHHCVEIVAVVDQRSHLTDLCRIQPFLKVAGCPVNNLSP